MLFFLVMLCSIWNLSALTRKETVPPAVEGAESQLLDHLGI